MAVEMSLTFAKRLKTHMCFFHDTSDYEFTSRSDKRDDSETTTSLRVGVDPSDKRDDYEFTHLICTSRTI